MANRPPKFPEWARVDYADPVLGGNNVIEPSEDKKDKGFLKEYPPAQYQNWLGRLTNLWIQYLDEIATGGSFTTGDAKHTIKTSEAGWLLMNDDTFGSAASGAGYASDANFNLYLLMWTNVTQSYAPVTGGRGVSAQADWDDNKPMRLTLQLGRAMVSTGGTLGYALGSIGGQNDVSLTSDNNGTHSHGGSAPVSGSITAHVNDYDSVEWRPQGYAPGVVGTELPIYGDPGNLGGVYDSRFITHSLAATISSSGLGSAHENRMPFSAWNVLIKL